MFTVSYADREGHILMFFNGQVPARSEGDAMAWQMPRPGDRSET
jgi:acyl-homoserine-lactone acylase